MIEILTNLIVITALGGSLLIVIVVVTKALISLAAMGSQNSDSVVVSEKVCKYCGAVLTGSKCNYCGAVRQGEE